MKSQKTCSSPKAPLTLKSQFQHRRSQQPYSFPPTTDEHFSISLTQFRMGKNHSHIRWGILFSRALNQEDIFNQDFFAWTQTSHLPVPFCSVGTEVLNLPSLFSSFKKFYILFFSFAFTAQNPFSMYRCLMTFHNTEVPVQRYLSISKTINTSDVGAWDYTGYKSDHQLTRASAIPKEVLKVKEGSERFGQHQSKLGSPLQAWGFQFPFKAYIYDLSATSQISFHC